MPKVQISKCGVEFPTTLSPHQHSTLQPSSGLPQKIKSTLGYCRLVHLQRHRNGQAYKILVEI